MRPGELYYADLPAANGREQHGRRPCLVLQDDRYARRLGVVLVVPLTKNLGTLSLPGTVAVPATPTNGLRFDSTALVCQLHVIDRKRFDPVPIGEIEPAILATVFTELDRLTGRSPSAPPGAMPNTTPHPAGGSDSTLNPPATE